MKSAGILLLSLVLLSACASVIQRRTAAVAVKWPGPGPGTIEHIEASGDLTMSWRKIDFSGSVSLQMDYPKIFVLELYGMFGQTIAYVNKGNGNFLLVAGDEKTTDRRAFEERYGLRLDDFIDDLAMKGEKRQVNGSIMIERSNYRVFYDQDRKGRLKITWAGADGRMQLLLTQVSFTTKEEPDDKARSGTL